MAAYLWPKNQKISNGSKKLDSVYLWIPRELQRISYPEESQTFLESLKAVSHLHRVRHAATAEGISFEEEEQQTTAKAKSRDIVAGVLNHSAQTNEKHYSVGNGNKRKGAEARTREQLVAEVLPNVVEMWKRCDYERSWWTDKVSLNK